MNAKITRFFDANLTNSASDIDVSMNTAEAQFLVNDLETAIELLAMRAPAHQFNSLKALRSVVKACLGRT